MKKLTLLCCLSMILSGLFGQRDVKTATKTVFIDNVHIFQKAGQRIPSGDILIRDGLIQEVGTSLNIPADAKVISGDSLYVYPGFIDGLSHTGIPEPKRQSNNARPEVPDRNYPPLNLSGVESDQEALSMIKPEDGSIKKMRELGFTTVHVVPRGRMLPGKGALLFMHEGTLEEMVYLGNTGQFAQFSGSDQRVFPRTLIGVMSKFREVYKQAMYAKKYEMAFEANPAGMERPDFSAEHQAFYPVIDKEQPIFFHTDDLKPIYRVLSMQEELGFDVVLANVKEGWYIADQLKEKQTPLLLSLDLPDYDKKETPEDMDDSQKAMEERRKKAMEAYHSQAAEMAKNGVSFGFSAVGVDTKKLKANLKKIMEAGLSTDALLGALTHDAAQILGVDEVMGTVQKGKIANLVVSKRPYFDDNAQVEMVIIDGKIYELEHPEKKGKGKKGKASK